MGAVCDIALALSLSFGGLCQPAPAPDPEPMPASDPGVWSFKPPPPPPAPEPKKEAAPAPVFPPIIIKQEAPAPASPPPPPPVVEPPPAYPFADAVRGAYHARQTLGATNSPSVAPAAGLPQTSTLVSLRRSAATAPLDFGAIVRTPAATEYQEKSLTSSLPVDNTRVVTTDRYIAAIVETGINTQLDGASGGPIVLQVTRDVFGYHGRSILIPKGSRLVCGFKPLEKVGSSRAPVRCSRVLLGGHRAEIFGAKANGADMQGYLGFAGEVDNRFWEKYGTAFILTGISTAVRAATASSDTNETIASRSDTLKTGGEELSQKLGEITASNLEQMINLTPVLRVPQGTRVQIRPDTDWFIQPAK